MKHIRAALLLTGTLLTAMPAAADEWPSRPVRMVNTFAAGGTADVLTRLVADQLSPRSSSSSSSRPGPARPARSG